MGEVMHLADKKVALKVVKDDYRVLQDRVVKVLLNLNVVGSMSQELRMALLMAEKDLGGLSEDNVNDAVLKEAVTDLVNMAFYARNVIDNSYISGDMIEEVYYVYTACKFIEDKWIAKT